MTIDLFQNNDLWDNLEQYNDKLLENAKEFVYSIRWDEYKNGASTWFDPRHIKTVPVGRPYPRMNIVGLDPKYNLCVYLAYYLPIFLLDKLYNKDVVIEDLGAGDGKFFYYISKLGYKNFHLIENFSQMHAELLYKNLSGIAYKLNRIEEVNPAVILNNGCFNINRDLTLRWRDSIELAVCYAHEGFDCLEFGDKMNQRGYRFLCRDNDNLAIAFCRNDKYDEFINKLKDYAI